MSLTRTPNECSCMSELQEEIDQLDAMLIELLVTRSGYIDRAIALKQVEDLPARIPARVNEVLDNVKAAAGARGMDPALAERLWTDLIEWSIAREEVVLGDAISR